MGNLDAKRDWGHARDYVEMQWLMLQQEKPQDFVIATGEQHSVREFIVLAAEILDMKLSWEGEGVHEQARDETGKIVVAIDPLYFRPTEVETLLGDPTKARKELGWAPCVSFPELVREMVESDYQVARRDALVRDHGYEADSFRES